MTMLTKGMRIVIMIVGLAVAYESVSMVRELTTTPLPGLKIWERIIFYGAGGYMLSVALYIFWVGYSRILEDDEE
jgi:hypothetical protein